MKSVYRYRQERHFAKPPAAIWPFVSDSARIVELSGMAPYRFEERADAQGRVRRYAHGKAGPFPVRWEEDFGEWQENRRFFQVRAFRNGPMRRWEFGCELFAEGEGCRLLVTGIAEASGLLGFVAKRAGIFDAEFGKAMAAIERLIRESDGLALIPGWSAEDLAEPAARHRLEALAAELARDPASHGLAPNLVDFLRHAPIVALRSIRPMALATLWSVPPDHAVELFLVAARNGIMAMGWDLLCPRCRGAKSRVSRLNELAKSAHCSSCNIDYERNFSRNVELTFHPEPGIRPLPDGELCVLGQGTARHVKFQAEVAARSAKSFDLSLAPGPYRFRTVEAGAEADGEIGADGVIPTLVARGSDILLEGASGSDELAIRNESDRPLVFVVEDRNWAQDALTGERVIAMPAFRRLCPEQLLRPGDNAEIGWIAIMFTDLQGSTKLYDALGDATAYNLVRDHFAFLSDRVQRNHGFVVKTVGDAVMAAFSRPDDAVRAALAIQDDVASFNSARRGGKSATPIVLKLGLHAGSCVAVTTGEVLDYFGSVVNTASRLEHQCRGGEVIISDAVLADPEAREALAGRSVAEGSATLRGLNEPARFVRVGTGKNDQS
jgi:class 3 adenylate cyclase